jgi:CheY-like chemotaxis protein
LPASITYHDLTEGIHTIGGARVATQFLNHPAMTLGYRVEADGVAIVYLVDHEPFSDELWRAGAERGRVESILHEGDRRHANFMADADLLIHDAQYTPEEYPAKKTWGHSAYSYVVEIATAARVKRVALTHHDPNHDDTFVAEIESRARRLALERGTALDVFCAYEGCEIVVEAQSTLKPFVAAAPHQPSVAQRQFRILVVDDQPDMLTLIVRALEDEHYIVKTASGGLEALRVIGEFLPDLPGARLQDDWHGRHGGHESDPRQSETHALPVLMLTAMTDEPSTRAGFDAGVTDYVTKPFSIPQLTARVRACLTRAQTS